MNVKEFLLSGKHLNDLEQNHRSKDICEAAIKVHGGLELQFVPLPLRTVRLTRLACGNLPSAYRHAPAGVRADYELATYALRRGGMPVWERIPEHIIDRALCLTAVKGSGVLLKVIPPKFKDLELCKTAVVRGGADPKDVPDIFKSDPQFWVGVALKHVPDEYKTHDICMAAVRKSGNYLQYVPEDLRDVFMCKAALADTAWAYRFVPARHFNLPEVQQSYRVARESGSENIIPELEKRTA